MPDASSIGKLHEFLKLLTCVVENGCFSHHHPHRTRPLVQQCGGGRSGSRNISVNRLYEGTRRANPIVRTSGSNTELIHASSTSEAPRLRHDSRSRREPPAPGPRASTTTDHSCSSSIPASCDQPSPVSNRSGLTVDERPRPPTDSPGRRVDTVGDGINGDIGRVKVSHRPENISRLTSPCNLLTPLRGWANRKAHDRHVEYVGISAGYVSAPSARIWSTGTRELVVAVERFGNKFAQNGQYRRNWGWVVDGA